MFFVKFLLINKKEAKTVSNFTEEKIKIAHKHVERCPFH